MGPDITHWHGTYEVAKHFYTKFIPELEHLVREGRSSEDDAKIVAADALDAKLKEVLKSENHRWFINETPPEEKAEREQKMKEFKSRYE
jgi:hydroxylamine dehydrogenase